MESFSRIENTKDLEVLNKNLLIIIEKLDKIDKRLSVLEKTTTDNTQVAVGMKPLTEHIDKVVVVLDCFENTIIPAIDVLRPRFLDNFIMPLSSSNNIEDENGIGYDSDNSDF